MAYTPQAWSDNDVSKPLSAARMTVIENGIQAAASTADGAATTATTANTTATTANTTANANTTRISNFAGLWTPYVERGGPIYNSAVAQATPLILQPGGNNAPASTSSANYSVAGVWRFLDTEHGYTGSTLLTRMRINFVTGSIATDTDILLKIYPVTGWSPSVSGVGFTINTAAPIATATIPSGRSASTMYTYTVAVTPATFTFGQSTPGPYWAFGLTTGAALQSGTGTTNWCQVVFETGYSTP